MLKSILLLASFFVVGQASAAFEYRVNHVQCENSSGRFERRKIFPAVKDETRLKLIPAGNDRGVIEYAAEHLGLSGGDCRVSFRLDYEFSGLKLQVYPQRQSLRRAGGYFAPCELLTTDDAREFEMRHTPNGFEIVGDDLTRLCHSSRRARVLIVLDRI
ncbi:MAG: hypothetical protein KF767_19000 [Bdellovibrionaceae bacterium]|nr:hypothetical protein [Pseudobdellovibrionaceae bacterium]